MTKSTGRVVSLTRSDSAGVSHSFPAHLQFLADRGYEYHGIDLPWAHPARRIGGYMRLAPLIRGSDLVITQEYFDAAAVSALLRLTGSKAKHLVVGLNVSSNRTLSTGQPALNRLANKLFFGRVDMAVVASKPEADIFARAHDIPRDRFSFVHWAYDLPQIEGRFDPPSDRPYFCLIGRNNRDHKTFCAALEGLDADGVIIGQQMPDIALGPNITAHAQIPFGDCISCIRGSLANVIIVNDADRGAGHITLVTGLHCAKAHIISHVDTALDYFTPGEHALTVPLADPVALRKAMLTLLDNPDLAQRMGQAAGAHAARLLTHERRSQVLEQRIRAWLDEGRIIWDEDPPAA